MITLYRIKNTYLDDVKYSNKYSYYNNIDFLKEFCNESPCINFKIVSNNGVNSAMPYIYTEFLVTEDDIFNNTALPGRHSITIEGPNTRQSIFSQIYTVLEFEDEDAAKLYIELEKE